MAIAVTVVDKPSVFGERRIVIADIVFSGNYATGGEAITAANLGLTRIDFLISAPVSAADAGTTGTPVRYDHSTGKMQHFESLAVAAANPLGEKDNAEAYVSGTKVRVMAVGI
jgi:hypothetical protein